MDVDPITGILFRDSRKDWIESATSFSWGDYITVVLTDSGHVNSASIQNIEDGTLWAGTPNFKLSSSEVKAIACGCIEDTHLRASGILLGGRHFTLTRITGQRIMVGRDARTGAGCIIYRCKLCLVTAVYEENNHPGSCYTTIVRLGDYLMECGF